MKGRASPPGLNPTKAFYWTSPSRGLMGHYHAWLFEDPPGGRVRLLTQETQKGIPAQELAAVRPNPMINAHQDWLEGLAPR